MSSRGSLSADGMANPAASLTVHRLPGDAQGQGASRPNAGATALLTWWSDSRELSFVELEADGPVLPVETLTWERGPERPERLV